MDFNIHEADVIIVGAGPSGLMAACQLLRFGIHPIIIDPRSSSEASSSIMLQARTLEIFRQMGIADEVLSNGFECKGISVQSQKESLGVINFNDLDKSITPFPFITIIPQYKVEQTLINQLTLRACPIYWNVDLVDLEQDDQKVSVTLCNNDNIVLCNAKWIVGADGIDSNVRKLIGLSFEGKTYKQQFFHADVEIEEEQKGYFNILLLSEVLISIVSTSDNGKFRIMGYLPENTADNIGCDEFKLIIDRALGFPLIKACDWIKCYPVISKSASKFAHQRCFLIGAAAHIHPPFSGETMNIGIQDAYNLSWKLANIVKGKQRESILQSYQQERQGIATYLKQTPDRIVDLILSTPKVFQRVRNYFIKNAFELIFNSKSHKSFLLYRLSHLGYRNSKLSVHHAVSKKVKSGDQIPYLPVFDEKNKIETDLHRWCEKPGFTLILMGNLNANHLMIIAKWLKQRYVQHMHLYYLPFSDRNKIVFDAFEVKENAHKMILVRPDMHIAYIHDVVSANLIDNFMVEIMKWEF